jgi:bifunctional non-homologous end joining protein LigD
MLKEYKRKRNFKVTPEPSGAQKATKKKAPRNAHKNESLSFVIQKHDATRLHYDFRLEIDGVMVSWAVPKGPSVNSSDKRLAVMTEDHPMEYSDFEGIIPEKQYGAGEVIIWDRGVYSPDENEEYSWDDKEDANSRMRKGLKRGKLSFYLKGEKLEGSWTLVRLRGKEKEWLLIKHRDDFEDSETDITEQDASVVSGKTLEDLQKPAKAISKSSNAKSKSSSAKSKASKANSKAKLGKLLESSKSGAFPTQVSPMLATLADSPFSLKGWFFEPKLDGVRAIAYIHGANVRLSSRRGLDLTEIYPAVRNSLEGYDGNYVFDGEVVALDENGKPSFQYLQQGSSGLRSFSARQNQEIKAHLVYYVFDILHADGKNLTALPLTQRKEILRAALKTNKTVYMVDSLGEDGETVFNACVENGLEGVVGKRADSVYEVGRRTRNWLKVKTGLSGEFLICGFTEGTGSRNHTFGSLLLGEYDDDGVLQYVGGVGTGFSEAKLKALLKQMKPLVSAKCPFKRKPQGKLNPTWLRPQMVAEVKYLERTQDNILRAPVYLNLRVDIEPKNVTETPVVHIETKRSSS